MHRPVPLALVLLLATVTPGVADVAPVVAQAPFTLPVASFNTWGSGANEDQPIDDTVAVLQVLDADIIGLQEMRTEGETCTADLCPTQGESRAQALANAMGYYVYEQSQVNDALWSNAILSRYPIGEPTPHDLGVAIDVDGRTVYAFNVHLDDSPYQPYQLLGIEYGTAPFVDTELAAVEFARATRGAAIDLLRADVALAAGSDAAFVFGDFNEPSHLDWTAEAAAAGYHPLRVAWPTTIAIEAMGFTDAYRSAHPDAVSWPGFTWTPTSEPTDPEDHHDRIDFVFARGETLEIQAAAIVGEAADAADVVVDPWPSDHRAVLAEVTIAA